MLKSLCFIFKIELISCWRVSHDWLFPSVFFLLVISLFPLALIPDPLFLATIMPGCIWIAALLASLLAVENTFFTEIEDGFLDQILLSQLPLTFIILAKLIARWVITELPLVLLTPLIGLLFNLSIFESSVLALSLLIGTPILTLTGSLCVALIANLRQQGMLLGLLMLPLVMPVLIMGVNIVQQFHAGFSFIAPLFFLAGLSALSISLLPFAIASVLRIDLT